MISNQWQETRTLINLHHRWLWTWNLCFYIPRLLFEPSRPCFMCTIMRILTFIGEGRNQVVAIYFLPISCIGIYHIWKSLDLHLWGNFSLNPGFWIWDSSIQTICRLFILFCLGFDNIGARVILGVSGMYLATGLFSLCHWF